MTPEPVAPVFCHAVGAPMNGTPLMFAGLNFATAWIPVTPGRLASFARFFCGTTTWMPL